MPSSKKLHPRTAPLALCILFALSGGQALAAVPTCNTNGSGTDSIDCGIGDTAPGNQPATG